MNNYNGHMGYGQPYPPPAGQFPAAGPAYPPLASSTYPTANQPAPAIGFAPPPGPGYPPAHGYPPAAPGYPPAGTGYPPAGPGYPPAGPGYPPAGTGYPPAGPGYPPAGPGYPPGGGYPAAGPAATYPAQTAASYYSSPSASYLPPTNNTPLPYPVHPNAPTPQPAMPAYPPAASSYQPAGPTQPPTHPHVAPPFAPPSAPAAQAGMSYDRGFQGRGTVKSSSAFNAEQDAHALRKAMKGFGTDEQTIINVLGCRSNQQRQQLKITFKTLFGRDLLKDLSSELSFKFKQTVLAMMMTPVEYDAEQLYKAIRGAGTNEEAIIEILCTRTNQQIRDIRTTYRTLYRNDLERDLVGDTSGHFRRFVVSLVTAGRAEGNAVDYERAKREAMELYQAGEARWGTDESKFNQILCSNSHAQLRAVFTEYQRVAHRSIQQSLSREMSGDLLMAMNTLANVVINPHKYFADRLRRSMKGAGTDDDTLIRVIVSRSEVDLFDIKQEFQRQYGQTLESWIQSDTSGDYCKMLMTLVRGN